MINDAKRLSQRYRQQRTHALQQRTCVARFESGHRQSGDIRTKCGFGLGKLRPKLAPCPAAAGSLWIEPVALHALFRFVSQPFGRPKKLLAERSLGREFIAPASVHLASSCGCLVSSRESRRCWFGFFALPLRNLRGELSCHLATPTRLNGAPKKSSDSFD